MKPMYTAIVTSTGGRHGRVQSSDGALKLELMPPSATVQNPTRTNPEQLFAAGYAACFSSAMEHIARSQKLIHGLITIVAKVHIAPAEEAFKLSVALDITVAEITNAQAESLSAAAHEVCPYSNAIRGNVEVALTAKGTV